MFFFRELNLENGAGRDAQKPIVFRRKTAERNGTKRKSARLSNILYKSNC